jgi:hypothetical protein
VYYPLPCLLLLVQVQAIMHGLQLPACLLCLDLDCIGPEESIWRLPTASPSRSSLLARVWCGSEPHLEPTNDLSVCLLEHAPVLVLIYSSIYTCGLSLYAKAQACLFLSVPSTHYLPNLRVSFGTLFFQPLWYVYYL